MAHANKIGVFIITIFPHAKKWMSAIINKIKHWKKIPKSAGHVGLPSSGPYFQTKTVPPIIIASNINGIKIDNKMPLAPAPSLTK